MLKFFTTTVAKLKFEALRELKEQQKKQINPMLKNVDGLPINVKLHLFPQSYPLDALCAGRILSSAGFSTHKLATPILFRGDTRAPHGEDDLFTRGFYRQIDDNCYHAPEINARRESFDCIATSKQVRYAIGFADARARIAKQDTSWVYMLYAPEGVDLTRDAGTSTFPNSAKLVDEVVLTGVPASHILAAIKFKVTNNDFMSYINPQYAHMSTPQVTLLDIKVNPHCNLAELDPSTYVEALGDFQKLFDEGVFNLQASPACKAEVVTKFTL